MIYIITPCTRIFNLEKIKATIPTECQWVICYDKKVKEPPTIDGAININSPYTGSSGNPTRNFAIENIKDQLNDDDWIYILDDDNIIHPDWYDGVKDFINQEQSMIYWGQCYSDGNHRTDAPESVVKCRIDTAQYMVRWDVAKKLSFIDLYEADGFYAEYASKLSESATRIEKDLCYFNYLRSNKYRAHDATRVYICMITMFKNEAGHLRKMLDSVTPYIDYWVIQDNGSTDGSPDIVRKWAEETGIPGKLYKIEEGWVNFGYNRDHLLQTALKEPHSCDWIMKMDCDETLEVDPGFDWSIFWTPYQAFHVPAVAPGLIYNRAWIWNAKLPWRFNHDPAHETIYLDDGAIGENFDRVQLPSTFRMRAGENHGESYTVPTKYVTDALKLEEKLIREGTMLTDLYHFFYIGKSYEDCYSGNFFPLKEIHQEEYAKRCIFYFENVVKYQNKGSLDANGAVNEMLYYALCGIGNAYRFLKDYDKAIYYYEKAGWWCTVRNEHIIHLAEVHHALQDYKKMLFYTTILMEPQRTCPFPAYYFLINTNFYHNTGKYPEYLHKIALEKINEPVLETILAVNRVEKQKKRVWIVDNFFDDPMAVRKFALQQEYEPSSDFYKGRRTYKQFATDPIRARIEKIMDKKIINWTETHGMCGRFQFCLPQDPLVYHYDSQTYAAMVYLNPDAPFSTGTNLYAHKQTRIRHIDDHPNADACFAGGFFDSTKFELVDSIGNVFNRLVIFDARCFHSAGLYCGKDIETARLFQIFFFD